jgi:hypothetical protein
MPPKVPLFLVPFSKYRLQMDYKHQLAAPSKIFSAKGAKNVFWAAVKDFWS